MIYWLLHTHTHTHTHSDDGGWHNCCSYRWCYHNARSEFLKCKPSAQLDSVVSIVYWEASRYGVLLVVGYHYLKAAPAFILKLQLLTIEPTILTFVHNTNISLYAAAYNVQ